MKHLLYRLTKKLGDTKQADGLEKRIYQNNSQEKIDEYKFNTSINLNMPLPVGGDVRACGKILTQYLTREQRVANVGRYDVGQSCRKNHRYCGQHFDPSQHLSTISESLVKNSALSHYQLKSVAWCTHVKNDQPPQWHLELYYFDSQSSVNYTPIVLNVHINFNKQIAPQRDFSSAIKTHLPKIIYLGFQQLSSNFKELKTLSLKNSFDNQYFLHVYSAAKNYAVIQILLDALASNQSQDCESNRQVHQKALTEILHLEDQDLAKQSIFSSSPVSFFASHADKTSEILEKVNQITVIAKAS